GLTYSYATEIFSHLILEEYKTAPPGVDPADNPEYEKNARKFAQKFFELTGVKLIPEMIDAQSEQAKNRIEEAFDLIVRSERMIRGDPTNQDWAFGALDGEK